MTADTYVLGSTPKPRRRVLRSLLFLFVTFVIPVAVGYCVSWWMTR